MTAPTTGHQQPGRPAKKSGNATEIVLIVGTCVLLVVLGIVFRGGAKNTRLLSTLRGGSQPQPTATAVPATPATASRPTAEGFRFAPWGTSKKDVRLLENARFVLEKSVGDQQVLEFAGELAGMKASIFYSFSDGYLSAGSYEIRKPFASYDQHLGDFVKVKSLLSQTYGAPWRDETVWHDRSARDNPQRWGRALAGGKLVFVAEWQSPSVEVSELLMGDNSQITLAVNVSSKVMAGTAARGAR